MIKNLEEILTPELICQELDEAGIPYNASPNRIATHIARLIGNYPLPNYFVSECDKAFTEAGEKAMSEGKSEELIRRIGRIAFCTALPKLSGATNIRDFIACVTHGMALEIIPGKDGSRLLYAAQVAHQALTKRPKKRNKSSHTSTATSAATESKSTT